MVIHGVDQEGVIEIDQDQLMLLVLNHSCRNGFDEA